MTQSSSQSGPRRYSGSALSLVGTTLDGRFELIEPIGQGAMGTVFLAKQLSVGRNVAVKVLREDLSPISTQRFMREAQLISSLSHPNIVQLYEFSYKPEANFLYFAMEYIDGGRLSLLNRRGRLHPNLVIEFGTQICSALAEAHSHGVVHRDLKPSNVMVRVAADGSVRLKVLDFGVARTLDGMDDLTSTGVLCGTPAYMAPEQAKGEETSHRTDLYALGINLFEMLSGVRPFRGGTPVETAVKQVHQPPPSLRGYDLPDSLVQLVEVLLEKDPSRRVDSASAVRDHLLAVRADLGWGPAIVDATAEDPWKPWVHPKLVDDESMDGWARNDPTGSTGALEIRRQDEVDTETSESLPNRQGGGWDAFNETPAAATHEHVDLMADLDVGADSQSRTKPAILIETPSAPIAPAKTKMAQIKRPVAPRDIPVDRAVLPDPPPRTGTTVDDRKPRQELTPGDILRFGLVAVMTFMGGVAVFYYISQPSEPEPSAAVNNTADQAADAGAAAEEAEPKKKKRKRKKVRKKPGRDEPIDLFGDLPPDDPDKPPIVIESGQ